MSSRFSELRGHVALDPDWEEFDETEDDPMVRKDLPRLFEQCHRAPSGPQTIMPEGDETENLVVVFGKYSSRINELVERRWQITLVEKVVAELRARVTRLEQHRSIIVPVETFEPEPFDALRPFCVVVEDTGTEFTATLYDANVSASGETQEDAVSNLKDMMLSVFEYLESEENLGAAMRHQKAVLTSIIRRR